MNIKAGTLVKGGGLVIALGAIGGAVIIWKFLQGELDRLNAALAEQRRDNERRLRLPKWRPSSSSANMRPVSRH
jgi:hypothetical protein